MRKKKLAPGDFIRMETRRGAVEVKVRADRDVPENMVFLNQRMAELVDSLSYACRG
jgi:formate dehydrogenase major subunit